MAEISFKVKPCYRQFQVHDKYFWVQKNPSVCWELGLKAGGPQKFWFFDHEENEYCSTCDIMIHFWSLY